MLMSLRFICLILFLLKSFPDDCSQDSTDYWGNDEEPELRQGIAAATGEPAMPEHPTCGTSLGIHECVRPLGHEGTHACDSECDLGHLREDELADGSSG